MKFIHTADWHLGKLFYGSYLTEEQEYILMHEFVHIVKEEKPDVIFVAGDLYDRSVPPAEAVSLCNQIFTTLVKELGVKVVAIAGNHDSGERLDFGSTLLDTKGLHIVGTMDSMRSIEIADEFGTVSVLPIPYCEPSTVRHFTGDETVRDYEDAMIKCCALQREKACSDRQIIVAHAFVTGGESSDSERLISLGGTELISADVFKDFNYVALGHLHGPQKIGREEVRYSGSLMKYSFGEWRQKKGVVIGTVDKDGTVTTTFRPLRPKRDLIVIEGLFADVMAEPHIQVEDYVLVRLTDRGRIIDSLARLREKYPQAMAVEYVGIQFGKAEITQREFRRMGEADMFRLFVEQIGGTALSEEEDRFMSELWKELEDPS